MSNFNFSGMVVDRSDPAFDAIVAAAYGILPRPRCLCRPKGVEMYVARVGERYIVKRMPHTGSAHQLACSSYESPCELSGMGQVMGTAILTNTTDGTTSLKLDFSMSKKPGGARGPASGGAKSDQVRTDGAKLTLRGMLHFLWSEAGFNKWFPAMAGKRSWYVIRKYLITAAQDKVVRNGRLSDLLYIPEPFSVEQKEAIIRRRLAQFRQAAHAPGEARQFLILLGELKEISDARFGKKLLVRHADCAFMLPDDLAKRLAKNFAAELELWNALDDIRLMVLATFSISENGIPTIEAMTLMLTSEHWIPIECNADRALVQRLTMEKRHFEKGLRYNMAADKVMASAILVDTRVPVALYMVPHNPPPTYEADLDRLKSDSGLPSWTWHTSAEGMPDLPPREQTVNVPGAAKG